MHGAMILLMLAAQLPDLKRPRPAPEQPIAFHHKPHVTAAKLECRQCHPIAEPGAEAGLPATSQCMACHVEIRKESEQIRKLAAFHREGRPVPWAPVYRIPDYVFFSHKQHLERAGATCETCHGAVREREALGREKDLSMAACMECHRAKSASLACNYCHDPK